MNLKRVNTVLLHTWFHFTHSMETWVDLFWNPVIDMLIFIFIAGALDISGNRTLGTSLILGKIFWNIIWDGQYGITVGALWEIWARSFSSLFITPLTMTEFIVGQMISSVIKSFVSFVVAASMGFIFFHFSVVTLGWMLPVYFALLLLFGWAVGFLVLALIFKHGMNVQSLSWSLVFLVQPFGGVFYPVSVLPKILQNFAYCFPTTYIYEAMRQQLSTGFIDWHLIAWGFLVGSIYFIGGISVFHWIFTQSKKNGSFVRMEG